MFQFPIRNSVRSDSSRGHWNACTRHVSIPHSEFCSFGLVGNRSCANGLPTFQFPIRNSVRSDNRRFPQWKGDRFGFNSPFGILFVRTNEGGEGQMSEIMFQFPIRNSVRSDNCKRPQGLQRRQGFNSPFGILFVRTCCSKTTR